MIPLAIKPGGAYYQVCSWFLDDGRELGERDRGLILFAAINIVQETLGRAGLKSETAWVDDHTFAVVLFDEEEPVDAAELRETLKEAQRNAENFLKFSWTVGIGGMAESDRGISQSFKESLSAVNYRIYRGKGKLIFYNELLMADSLPIQADEWVRYQEKIVAAVKARHLGNMESAIDELCEWIEQVPDMTIHRIQYMFYSVLMEMEKMMYELNIDRQIIYSHGHSVMAIIDSCQTLVEMKGLLQESCAKMIGYLDSKQFAVKSSLVQSITEYIEKNYDLEQLGLEHTAERFGMNPSYLGQLIKKETGKTFLQFVSEYRIDKAKELLVDFPKPIHEVAALVGYVSRSTFIRVFKNHVGITPSEYRNRLLLEENTEIINWK